MGLEIIKKLKSKVDKGRAKSYEFKEAIKIANTVLTGWNSSCDAYSVPFVCKRISDDQVKISLDKFTAECQFDFELCEIKLTDDERKLGSVRLVEWDDEVPDSQKWDWMYFPTEGYSEKKFEEEHLGDNISMLSFLAIQLYRHDFCKPEKYRLQ